MAHDHTRRWFVMTGVASAVAALSGRVADAGAQSVPEPTTTFDGEFELADVVAVDPAGRVRTTLDPNWLPLDGFPEGWAALPHDRVVVTTLTTTGARAACPLVHCRRVMARPTDLTRPGTLGDVEITPSTVVANDLEARRRRSDTAPVALTVWLVDRAANAGMSNRAVAVRAG
jgi:hypothetical protein